VVVAGASTIALAAGFLAGFHYAKRELEEACNARADEEIAQAKKEYAVLYKKDEYETPEGAAERLIGPAADALRKYRTAPLEEDVTDKGVTKDGDLVIARTEHIFRGPSDVDAARNAARGVPQVMVRNLFEEIQKEHRDNQEAEEEKRKRIRNRSEEAPYIISKEEYFRNEEDMTQSVLTYFQGDGVLCDERDDLINEIDETVGVDNLLKFGVDSGDPNVVYVRNHVLDIEFEINLSHGSYAQEVAGLSPEK
jgi:hypothetical protein